MVEPIKSGTVSKAKYFPIEQKNASVKYIESGADGQLTNYTCTVEAINKYGCKVGDSIDIFSCASYTAELYVVCSGKPKK